MKKLYIVRHAKSSWENSFLADDERPLNNRGKKDAPIMAQHLKGVISPPEKIISSHAIRAYDTALIFAEAFEIEEEEVIIHKKMYHASLNDLFQEVTLFDDAIDSIMLFGHNPGLTEFVNKISGSSIDNISTCGVAGIFFDVDSWQNLNHIRGSLEFYYYPKGLL